MLPCWALLGVNAHYGRLDISNKRVVISVSQSLVCTSTDTDKGYKWQLHDNLMLDLPESSDQDDRGRKALTRMTGGVGKL